MNSAPTDRARVMAGFLIALVIISTAAMAEANSASVPPAQAADSAIAVTLTDPNGGEQLNATESFVIRWSFTGAQGTPNFDLHYSLAGTGGPWTVIRLSTGNVNGYLWNSIPTVQSTNAYIRVTARDNAGTDTDMNNAAFTFYMPPAPVFHVKAPNGGESYVVGASVDITWNGVGRLNRINLSYSTTGTGGPWTLITNTIPNIGIYSWPVPNLPTTNAFIKVHANDLFGRPGEDASNASFSIVPPPFTVKVTTPMPGSLLTTAQSTPIGWTTSGGTGPYRTDLSFSSTGTGGPWSSVATGLAGNAYTWTVPSTLTTIAFVRANVTDTGTSKSAADANDGPFTIARPVPVAQVIMPNGGEKLMVNATATVQWTGSGGSGALTYDVAYSLNGLSGPWTDILTGSSLTSTPWLLPPPPSASAFIRVKATDGFESAQDLSDSAFEIVKSVPAFTAELLSPVGGETWQILESHDITWKSTGLGPLRVDLHYSVSGQSGPWQEIALDLDDSGSHSWSIPLIDRTSTFSFVRVTLNKPSTGEMVVAMNPNVFTINRPPYLSGVTGQVVDLDSKKPLEGVQVRLANTPHVTMTDVDGMYTLTGVRASTYTLEASLGNYDLYSRSVELPTDDLLVLKIELVSQFSASKGRQNIGALLVEWALWIIVLLVLMMVVIGVAVSMKRRTKRVKPSFCFNCGNQIPGGQVACARCGPNSNNVPCPRCKCMIPSGSGKCGRCGLDLSRPPAPPGPRGPPGPPGMSASPTQPTSPTQPLSPTQPNSPTQPFSPTQPTPTDQPGSPPRTALPTPPIVPTTPAATNPPPNRPA